MSTRSRSSLPGTEDELRLPRVPGVVRRFWARHPVLADVLIALLFLALSLVPATTFRSSALQGIAFVIVPLTFAACALLLRRRQWPVVVFATSIVLSAAFLFAPPAAGAPIVLVTSYSLAVYRSSRAAWIGFGAGIGGLAVLALVVGASGVATPSHAANVVSSTLVLTLIGTLIGVNIGGRKRYLEAIIDRSRQLLVERDQQAQLAAAAERARIAREMHDIVSHSLTVIVALAEGATATTDAGRARAATAQVADTARGALHEMRAMLGVLRDESGGDAPLAPMDDDLVATAVEAARRAGFPVTLRDATVAGERAELPRPVALAVGRIVQEGLTNAMRHAPAATTIEVTLTRGDDEVTVQVRNDGVRATAAGGGYGLRGLRERVGHVAGSLDAGSFGTDGWLLRARLPLRPEAPAPGHRTDGGTA